MQLLIPGVGKQGGPLAEVVAAGVDRTGSGMIINSSRDVIFASSGEDFAAAAGREAKKLNDAIKVCLAGNISRGIR
jgi:orotidine-5'-phosphate decarboxylase